MASAAPLRISLPSKSTPDMLVCAVNGTNRFVQRRHIAAAQPIFFFGQTRQWIGLLGFHRPAKITVPRPPFPRLATLGGNEFRSLPVSQSDGPGLIEQQRVDIARRFHRVSRHGQHIVLDQRSIPAMPMAESNPPIVVGMRHTSSETSTNTVCGAPE